MARPSATAFASERSDWVRSWRVAGAVCREASSQSSSGFRRDPFGFGGPFVSAPSRVGRVGPAACAVPSLCESVTWWGVPAVPRGGGRLAQAADLGSEKPAADALSIDTPLRCH